jgi:muramoyltetrapeptide carboxypeptidase
MKIHLPPWLQKGDTIGIVAPAGFMPVERMQNCIEILDSWGFTVRMGATTHSSSENYFSGTDDERLADLQQMLDDDEVKAILCARGGFGVSRIIDRLDFHQFKKNPKWIIGFSDITVLHAHIYQNYRISTLHAPMAAAFNDGEAGNPFIKSLRDALEGRPLNYECPAHSFNRSGAATAPLVGGNLSIIAHLIGTESDFPTKNRILFLEDVGEYLYSVDRMLVQLKRSGKLSKLAGLVIGGFTDNKDTERPYGSSIYDIISGHVQEYDYPVCFGFPVSHEKENYALRIGVEHTLEVSGDGVVLSDKTEEDE